MNLQYAREKLGAAVDALVSGAGSLKERIWTAYLCFHPLTTKDFGPDLVGRFKGIEAFLTDADPNGGEGTVKAALAAMSDDDCSQLASRLLCLYVEVIERTPDEE